MDRKRYWASVGTREIVPQGEGANYEFEIEATDEEINLLRKLFEEEESSDHRLVGRAKTPYEAFPENDQEIKNLPFDEHLQDIYRFIHYLGSPRTKEHISGMGILL
ncbi:MAG TPA: hypothetical protein VGE40_03040 [Bacilli bacterium]